MLDRGRPLPEPAADRRRGRCGPAPQAERAFLALGREAERYLRAAAAQGTARIHERIDEALTLAAHARRAAGAGGAGARERVRPLRARRSGGDLRRARRHPAGAAAQAEPLRLAGLPAVPATLARRLPDARWRKPLDSELEAGLRRLKLRRVRELAPELLQTARTQRWRPEELLAALVREEIEARERSNLARRLKAAGFPGHKTLDGFDPAASELPRATFEFLRSLEWLERKDNLCLAGPAGTGKSHLGEALGRAACQAGHRVRFFAADDLIEALYRGLADNTVGKLIRACCATSS